jgi:hypothetical protein
MNWITRLNIEDVSSAEQGFRHVFTVSNGRKITVREPATTPIKTDVTEGEKTNNDGMHSMKTLS